MELFKKTSRVKSDGVPPCFVQSLWRNIDLSKFLILLAYFTFHMYSEQELYT